MESLCSALPRFMCSFPELGRGELRNFKKSIDNGFESFAATYGQSIDDSLGWLQSFLNWWEDLFIETPWPLPLLVILALVWFGSRSKGITAGTLLAMLAIGVFGLWEDAMLTLALVSVSTLIAIVLGVPIGILMSRSNKAQATITPVLDVMQTMPSFVYLIPVVILFGIGKVPGLIAIVIYGIPPIIRLTNLGVRLVDKDVLEAADAFGSSSTQRLTGVQMPLALPTIMAGVNQTIMMCLAMVVIASLIGVGGLGKNVLQAIATQQVAQGLLNGFALVAIAIIFDRASQAYGKRLQKHSEVVHG